MTTGMPLASWKSQVFESVLGFLPEWAQTTGLALILLAVVVSWIVKIRNRAARRRAAASAPPAATVNRNDQGRGADHLGPYAPRRQQGSGADHLGPYAPRPAQPASGPTTPPTRQPSGADFLGAYAPRQGQGEGTA